MHLFELKWISTDLLELKFSFWFESEFKLPDNRNHCSLRSRKSAMGIPSRVTWNGSQPWNTLWWTNIAMENHHV